MNVVAKGLSLVAMLAFISHTIAAPVRDSDPVFTGTVWKGKLTQKGEFMGAANNPPEFDCEFTITKRSGEKFEAELFEKTPDLELTYIMKGTIKPVDPKNADKGYKIEFESVEAKGVKNTAPITKIPYSGVVKDKKMKGTWKHPENSDNTTLEGEFDFELTKKKD